MTHYDEQLQELQEKIVRAKQLGSKIAELKNQRNHLRDEVSYLGTIKFREQADVDRLEGRSLLAFFYNVIGKMDEKLDQERQEAYAARVKCDAAERELAAVEAELCRYEREFDKVRSFQKQYDALFAEKAAAVKLAGGERGEQLLQLEQQYGAEEHQRRELQEAVYAGNSALSSAQRVLDSLGSAEGWGTFDLLGGGLISDIAKYSHLDQAQGHIEQLQSDLRRFKTELADVQITADLQVSVDGFLRFADYFFDNIFTDWAVMDKISRAKMRVEDTQSNISQVLHRLNRLLNEAEARQRTLRGEIDRLVQETQL
ncbi:MAG: hypothetical protein IKL23_04000 [Oscillospiraceae bacterium]|nr:hypothetical protein [Oscillospiraceae bacterium]